MTRLTKTTLKYMGAVKDSVIPDGDQIKVDAGSLASKWSIFSEWYQENIRDAGVLQYVELFDAQQHYMYSEYTNAMDQAFESLNGKINAATTRMNKLADNILDLEKRNSASNQ